MRIAIIGSGVSGLVSAWLLDGKNDVTLYEASGSLGGHAHTYVSPDGLVADCGIHLFHKKQFARFARLIDHLGVPTRTSFTRATIETPEHTTVFPPLSFGSVGPLRHQVRLAQLLRAGSKLVDARDTQTTLRELGEQARIPESFMREVFAPLTAGMWGTFDPEEMMQFSAFVPLWYFTRLNFRASEIVGGTRVYIDKLRSTLRTTRIYTHAPVTQLDRGWRVHGERYDAVIIATNATQAHALLPIPALRSFRYYKSTIAVHRDASVMPVPAYCSVRYDGALAQATFWKKPLFTTWLHPQLPEPKGIEHRVTFEHPFMTPLHYRAQRELERAQGEHGAFFAGVYTGGVDSHESGVASAVRVARRLPHDEARMNILSGVAQSILFEAA